ncbi:MAG: hypothetical protein RMK29_09225 [Myxococcales bacterium]|nr:hypothetical protein [Myxococcota bacterium]MDW8281880.1 hypothetical protein [Myxococcales bacterium]
MMRLLPAARALPAVLVCIPWMAMGAQPAKGPAAPSAQAPAKAAALPSPAQPAMAPPAAPAPPAEPEPEPTLEGVMRALGAVFKKQLGEHHALRLYCEFLAARALFGRAIVYGVGEVEAINVIISRAQQRAGRDAAMFTQLLSEYFPRALVATDGNLWRWQGSRYALDFPVVAWDIDAERGTLYAANLERKMLWFDPRLGRFRPNGLEQIRDLQATQGVVYYLTTDGALMMRLRGQSSRILDRPVSEGASLHASRGVLYLLEGGALLRYAGGTWDRDGTPIQRNVRLVAADGPDYYAIDQAGHIYSSAEGRYIEPEGSYSGLWLIGKHLLALSRTGRVNGYDASKRAWQVLR